MKGKDINPSRPRQILHSVTVSRGEVVRSEVAGKGNSVTNTKSGTMINEHGDIKGEVLPGGTMDGIMGMVGKQAVRRNETYTQAFTNDFEFTGDGVSSGRWKGKGVDRKIHDEFEFELGEDEDEVMRSIEREVIELSD